MNSSEIERAFSKVPKSLCLQRERLDQLDAERQENMDRLQHHLRKTQLYTRWAMICFAIQFVCSMAAFFFILRGS